MINKRNAGTDKCPKCGDYGQKEANMVEEGLAKYICLNINCRVELYVGKERDE